MGGDEPNALFVVSVCCPVGCGDEVVLLKSQDTGAIFCFCPLCGCGWATPEEAHFEVGLEDVHCLPNFAPSGAVLPALAEVQAAGLMGSVLETISEDRWWTSLEDVNQEGRETLADMLLRGDEIVKVQ